MHKKSAKPSYMDLPGYTPATPEMIVALEQIAEEVRPKIDEAIKGREEAADVARKIRVR